MASYQIPPQGLGLPNGKFFVCIEVESSEAHKGLHINSAAVVQPRDDCNLSSVIVKFDGLKVQDMSKQEIVLEQLLSSLQEVEALWYDFFLRAKVPYHILESIKQDNRNQSKACFREAIVKWLDLATVKAMDNQQKQAKIVETLDNIGSGQLAKSFKWPAEAQPKKQ
ncbi:hypothetical protein D5018_04680 [Parashewanella curva]|uniref:Uncharacterized protein n=1 Tax=Parashewanella curva TaxID=2338552 RepID=A0A3L8Q000_9GAMM|nr:hypothetical protein [Parashewanella curva]RLV60941.1 hypothetical protein D5018_04680 [Parashewanella curva]